MSQTKWIILQEAPDVQPAWFGDDDKPVVHDTEKDAVVEMLSEYIVMLESQLEDVKNDQRQCDEIDLQCPDFVSSCTIDDDGVISTETDGVIYNPTTFIR